MNFWSARGESAVNNFAAGGRTRMPSFPSRDDAAQTRSMHLVRQMIPPRSTMAKLKRDGKEKHIFVWMGASNAVLTALIGPLSVVFRTRVLITVLNGAMLFSSPLMVSGEARGCVTRSRTDRPNGSMDTCMCA